MTNTPVISKGSSFILSSGSLELKATIIEDPTPTVGEASNITLTGHDGTKYTIPGETSENGLNLELIQTYEDFTTLMTYAYGSPTINGSVSTWDLESPSGTSGTVTITPPASGSDEISWILTEAKALSIQPGLPKGGFARMSLNLTGSKWKAAIDENA